MKILISYVIQGEKNHHYNSEIVDLKLNTPLYSPEPPETEIEIEIVKWAEMRQSKLRESEKIIVLKTLKTN
ncbi:MAG: hypothetical protein ACYDH1_20270 [Anaerolineaceae bacterium]